MTNFSCSNNNLTSLNLANGNNEILREMDAFSNPDLICIQIDLGCTPPPQWEKDLQAEYSDNCQ
jgi:hypothetical protein